MFINSRCKHIGISFACLKCSRPIQHNRIDWTTEKKWTHILRINWLKWTWLNNSAVMIGYKIDDSYTILSIRSNKFVRWMMEDPPHYYENDAKKTRKFLAKFLMKCFRSQFAQKKKKNLYDSYDLGTMINGWKVAANSNQTIRSCCNINRCDVTGSSKSISSILHKSNAIMLLNMMHNCELRYLS